MSATRIPLWLLSTFGCGANVDVLIGDLIEEQRAGRSATWLWRQALMGVVSACGAEIRTHPVLMCQQLAVALIALRVWAETIEPIAGRISDDLMMPIVPAYDPAYVFACWLCFGRVVSWLHRPHHKVATITCACALVMLFGALGRLVHPPVACAVADVLTDGLWSRAPRPRTVWEGGPA